MDQIYNHGVISTSMPGTEGSNGQRASITYFSTSYDVYTNESNDEFDVSINNEKVKIHNHQHIEPQVNDFIVYSKDSIIYLVKMTTYSNKVWSTEILDTWVNSEYGYGSTQTSTDDISIKINVSDKIYNISSIDENANLTFETTGAEPVILNKTSSTMKTFSITSTNDNNIGTCRIELEFVTDLVSPNMDSIIASKFLKDDNNTHTQNKIDRYSSEIDKSEENYMTLRGFLNQYDRKEDNGSLISYHRQQAPVDFDIEYLERFSLILKDFNDGSNSKYYNTDVTIPTEMLYRVTNNVKSSEDTTTHFTYKCFIYIYTKNSDGITYYKQLIGEIPMSEFLRNN